MKISILSPGLSRCVSLKRLFLTHQKIGPSGAVELANALCKLRDLQYLNIGFNLIEDRGAIALAKVV